MYEPRWYRDHTQQSNLHTFTVKYKETDLWIGVNYQVYSQQLQDYCEDIALSLYTELEHYLRTDPGYLHSLVPYYPKSACPSIAYHMSQATAMAGVGPMAAVAGTFAQEIAARLDQKYTITDLIIENGGDIFLRSSITRRISIWAGSSVLSGKLAIEITPEQAPLGICTSSGTVGHSLSFGKADAVTILSNDTAVADAYATAVGNIVKTPQDIEQALDYCATQPEISGAIIIIGEHIGLRGNVKLVKAEL